MTNDPKTTLANLIAAVFAPLTIDDALPQNAILQVFDHVDRTWIDYAEGGTATWFIEIIDTDSLVDFYRGARLIGHYGSTLLSYRW